MEDLSEYPWLALRGRTYYIRPIVPADILETFGKEEIWKSLRTKDFRQAVKRWRIGCAEFEELFEAHRREQVRLSEPPLEELSDGQLKTVEDAYFSHLLEEDDEIRESGFEGRDFDNEADLLETHDEINREEFARGQRSAFMLDEAQEVLSWDNVALRLADASPSWPKVVRAVCKATIRANEIKRQWNTGAVIDTPRLQQHHHPSPQSQLCGRL